MKQSTLLLWVVLFSARLVFGLGSEFWFEDELQIYLIGLKSYTTGTWPYYGPDVVYTQTQIPGALQGLLVSVPLHVCAVPEAPIIFLNLLSSASLLLLGWYISIRVSSIPQWLTLTWVMCISWTMDYSTRVVNPSYVIVFSIPFFLSFIEALPIYETRIISKKLCYFLMGICLLLVMQLHLSYVLLIPYIVVALIVELKGGMHKTTQMSLAFFLLGVLLGSITLIPTLLLHDHAKSISSNMVFNTDNYKNFFIILSRFLSFASFEIPYILGGSTRTRLDVINSNLWMAPFALVLLVAGFCLVAIYLFYILKRNVSTEMKKIRQIMSLSFLMLFLSFFFSIKSPSSHTFCVLLPIPVIYSFYCFDLLLDRNKKWMSVMIVILAAAPFFYAGLGIYNFRTKSLYTNRQRVCLAISQKDYKTLSPRRADTWGYGY